MEPCWSRLSFDAILGLPLLASTPANWVPGEDVIIIPAVGDDEARERFPEGWSAAKPYLRIVPQPKD